MHELNQASLHNDASCLIDLLEIDASENGLLKLTRQTDIDTLKKSIEKGDHVNAAGHLVSLVSIKYGSVNRTPRSLLTNEIGSSLSSYLNTCIDLLNGENG